MSFWDVIGGVANGIATGNVTNERVNGLLDETSDSARRKIVRLSRDLDDSEWDAFIFLLRVNANNAANENSLIFLEYLLFADNLERE